jgi:pimeloyl-ACP methyl ester carboxylesterase
MFEQSGGSEDRIAPLAEVHRLSKDGSQGKWPVIILQGSGHNCVFEQPAQWRKALLSFLD